MRAARLCTTKPARLRRPRPGVRPPSRKR